MMPTVCLTRSEYWDEVEQLLDVSDDKLDKNTQ